MSTPFPYTTCFRSALERGPYGCSQVFVVFVAVHQRRAHVGEPAADAGLHGGVVLNHLVETVAVVAQGRRARGLGHVGGQAGPGGVVGVRVQRVAFVPGLARARLGFGPALEPALADGDLAVPVPALLLPAGGARKTL